MGTCVAVVVPQDQGNLMYEAGLWGKLPRELCKLIVDFRKETNLFYFKPHSWRLFFTVV